MHYTYTELAGMIDHSLLHPALTNAELEKGCLLALNYQVATVCVKPYFVTRAAELLKNSGVLVGTVAGFPHGANSTAIKKQETAEACREGAAEIDMVINIGHALSGDWAAVETDIREVCEEAHSHRAIVKVIFENDYIADDATKIRLCQISEAAGADFVKTSTGFGFVKKRSGDYNYRGAAESDIVLMRKHCSPRVQVKAAGGVRDLDTMIRMRELGAARCGTSATATIMEELKNRLAGKKAASPADRSGGGY